MRLWLGLIPILCLSALAQGQPVDDPPFPRPPTESEKQARRLAFAHRDWSRIRGVNYVPSYAASSREIWLNYDAATVRRELAKASDLGFNSVRIWLNYDLYEEKPTKLLSGFKDFVDACRAEKLSVMPILFDSTGIDPSSHKPERETILAAFERFLSRPDAYPVHPEYARYSYLLAREIASNVSIPVSNDPAVIFWGDWTSTPGPDRLKKDPHSHFDEYVKAVIEPFKNDTAILAWDVMNEPDSIHILSPPGPRPDGFAFARSMIEVAKSVDPSQPITVGASKAFEGASIYSLYVDLTSLHLNQRTIAEFQIAIRESKRLGKPLLVTECGAVLFPAAMKDIDDSAREENLRLTLSALDRDRTGFFLWHLIEGKIRTPWAALLDAQGNPKPSAVWLRTQLRSAARLDRP